MTLSKKFICRQTILVTPMLEIDNNIEGHQFALFGNVNLPNFPFQKAHKFLVTPISNNTTNPRNVAQQNYVNDTRFKQKKKPPIKLENNNK